MEKAAGHGSKQQPSRAETETKKAKFWGATAKATLIVCALTLPVALLFFRWQATSPPVFLFEANATTQDQEDIQDDLSPYPQIEYDRLLGGLLVDGFDERSCLSRYQFARYHRKTRSLPSDYLVERIRKQEALQKKCGPGTDSYKKAVDQLKSGKGVNMTDCNYLVSISHAGLGNRMLVIASAFLYAVLTDRVLLVDRFKDVGDLFCEPFPETSWLLPLDFPLNYRDYNIDTQESYGNMVKNNEQSSISSRPFVYLHLDGNYQFFDKLFFCEDDQQVLRSVPWLVLRTDMYFVPGLFLIPAFQDELSRLFPDKDAVFHHLGRYLLHPSNVVWRSVKRYYHTYLARADQRIGIQIRVLEKKGILQRNGPFQHVLDQILSCTHKEKLLPEVNVHEPVAATKNAGSKAVLMTCLSSWYYEQIRDMYRNHGTTNGEIVRVYQPSHEEYQKSKNKWHNMKALGEIYLLSMTDVLVTTGFSTFGYVAQGLGGLKPWIMFKPETHVMPDPPCRRAMSIEPCFHNPSYYDCKAKKDADPGKIFPHVKRCEDVSWGLKLVNQTEW